MPTPEQTKSVPKTETATKPGEAPVPAAPESEVTLTTLATQLGGETVLKLQGGEHDILLYGVLQHMHAVTEKSDFFRAQFKGYTINDGHTWTPFNEEDAHYQLGRNCAWARVDHPTRTVSFGPRSGIAVGEKLYSPGLDDFLFACVVAWAKNTYPDYAVSPGVIMLQSRATEEDKLRRQSFYAKQGFEFEWTDEAQRSGVYHKDKVGRLIGVYSSGLIAEFGGEAMLQTLIKQDEERRAMEQRLNKAESLNNAVHQALDKERHTTQMLMVILMLLLLIVLWAVL